MRNEYVIYIGMLHSFIYMRQHLTMVFRNSKLLRLWIVHCFVYSRILTHERAGRRTQKYLQKKCNFGVWKVYCICPLFYALLLNWKLNSFFFPGVRNIKLYYSFSLLLSVVSGRGNKGCFLFIASLFQEQNWILFIFILCRLLEVYIFRFNFSSQSLVYA